MHEPDAVRRQYASESNLQTRLSVWRPTPDGRDPAGVALEAIVDAAPARMLEVGCGTGAWSVAGDESYILKVRVPTPADHEDLLAQIRADANVSTRTTIVLSTPYENRPVT